MFLQSVHMWFPIMMNTFHLARNLILHLSNIQKMREPSWLRTPTDTSSHQTCTKMRELLNNNNPISISYDSLDSPNCYKCVYSIWLQHIKRSAWYWWSHIYGWSIAHKFLTHNTQNTRSLENWCDQAHDLLWISTQ